MMNSFNHVFKDAFYNLEKRFARLKIPRLKSPQQDPVHSIMQKSSHSSMSSGEFLDRARRGETLHQDKQTDLMCREFVRTRTVSAIDEIRMPAEGGIPAPDISSGCISEEIPEAGLKASLHASTDHASFENWKSVHQLLSPDKEDAESQESPSSIYENTAKGLKAEDQDWRELSVHTALRLIDHPQTPAFVLMELSQHPSPEVRAQVVDNPNTPQKAILNLISDQCIDVRLSLAECYHLGASVLEFLVQDDNPYVGNRAEITLHRLQADSSPPVVRGSFGMSGADSREAENVTKIRALA